MSARLRWVLLLGVLLPVQVQAQTPARVSGQVVDSATGGPVPYPRVELGGDTRQGDAQGRFQFEAVSPGYARLRTGALGYAVGEQTLDIAPGEAVTIRVALQPSALHLQPLVARARPDASSISGAELEARGATLAQALDGWQGLVMVRRDPAGAAEPQAPGGGPDELLVTLDGFPLNDPFTGRADLSRLASRDIAQVSLARGVRTTEGGGRAISGVLAITTRPRLVPEVGVWAGSNQARGARIAVSLAGISASLSAEQTPRDFAYTVPGGGQATRDNADGTLYRLYARSGGRWEILLRASASDRGLPGTITNPTPAARARDHAAFLGLSRHGTVDLRASAEWLRTRAWDPDPPPGFVAYDGTTEGLGFSAALAWSRPFNFSAWQGRVRLSADARHDRFQGDAVRDGARFTRGGAGARLSLEHGNLQLVPSFRADAWSGRAGAMLSARMDAALGWNATRFTAGLGSGTSTPVLADLLFRDGVGIRVNPDLRPERVQWEASAGVSHDLSSPAGPVRISLQGSIGRVADMVLWSPDFRFVWSPQNFNVRRRLASVGLNWHPQPGLAIASHTQWSVVTYDIPGGAQVRYRPRFTETLSASWSPGPWRAGAWWHHLGSRFPNSAGINALPAVDVLDLTLERRLSQALQLRLALNDLTDARPTYIAGYPTPGRRFSLTISLDLP